MPVGFVSAAATAAVSRGLLAVAVVLAGWGLYLLVARKVADRAATKRWRLDARNLLRFPFAVATGHRSTSSKNSRGSNSECGISFTPGRASGSVTNSTSRWARFDEHPERVTFPVGRNR